MSLRQERMKKEFFRIIKEFFTYEVNNPVLQGIAIQEVLLTRDLSYLKVYYTIATKSDKLDRSLEKVAPAVKATLSNQMKLRKVPNVLFVYDERAEHVNNINSILNKITYSEQKEEDLIENYKNLDIGDL